MSEVVTSSESISNTLLEYVAKRLVEGRPVRRKLPPGGRLHIDRPLPFLCVYRYPAGRIDSGTDRLVIGEASFLIATGDHRLKAEVTNLVRMIAGTMADKFGAFLIVEVWASSKSPQKNGKDTLPPQPAFRILTSRNRPPTRTVEALAKSLRRIKLLKQPASVEIVVDRKRSPSGLPMLLSSRQARQLRCYIVGLEIQPVYRPPKSNEVYPVLLRTLHRHLSRTLKRTFFEFARTQTSYTPDSHHALGRRAVVRAVWEVDRQLAAISNSFDFLLQVTPVNINQAWTEFKRLKLDKPPVLYYRPMPVDPAVLKARLYNISLEAVEDPTLALLFRQKRMELDRQVTMLSDRGSKQFLYGSLQLFGDVSSELYDLAITLLKKISPRSHERNGGHIINARAFAKYAQTELDYYHGLHPDFSATVQIRGDTVGLMVSRGNLLIGRETKVAKSRVEALIQHEIGTHVLTYFNGSVQPFQQLYTGLAGYEELQEGLAVLAEYLVGGLSRPRLRLLAGRVVAARCLIDGASFIETFRVLHKTHGFSQQVAYTITVRIYRGGGFTKDAVYLRGLVGVLQYLKNGGQLEPLFVGKIAANHIPIIQELQSRQVLHPIALHPRYLTTPESIHRLAYLRSGVSVLNLIERKSQ